MAYRVTATFNGKTKSSVVETFREAGTLADAYSYCVGFKRVEIEFIKGANLNATSNS